MVNCITSLSVHNAIYYGTQLYCSVQFSTPESAYQSLYIKVEQSKLSYKNVIYPLCWVIFK